jgi:hypothetical protein
VRVGPEINLTSLPPPQLKLILILERLCGGRSYCWYGNKALARLYGLDGPSGGFRDLLRSLEGDPQRPETVWISRQRIDPGRPGAGRLGIFLHRRLDGDRPTEEGPPPPPEAVDRLRHSREHAGALAPQPACTYASKQAAPMPEKGRAPMPEKRRAPMPEKRHQIKDRYRKEDGLKEDERGRAARPIDPPSRQRQRPETSPPMETPSTVATLLPRLMETLPVMPPSPPVETPPPPPAATRPSPPAEAHPPRPAETRPSPPTETVAPAPAPGLIEGQRRLLEALDDGQRAALEAMPAARRAAILEPHAKGFDAHVLAFQIRSRMFAAPPPQPVAPPEPPADTAELIRRLPGAVPHWAQLAAEDVVRRFGTEKDRRLWGQLHLIMQGVWAGRIDPEIVVNCFGQAMRPGIEVRGAKFWAAFRCQTGMTAEDLKGGGP